MGKNRAKVIVSLYFAHIRVCFAAFCRPRRAFEIVHKCPAQGGSRGARWKNTVWRSAMTKRCRAVHDAKCCLRVGGFFYGRSFFSTFRSSHSRSVRGLVWRISSASSSRCLRLYISVCSIFFMMPSMFL